MFWHTFWHHQEAKSSAFVGVLCWVLAVSMVLHHLRLGWLCLLPLCFAASGGLMIGLSIELVHQRQHAARVQRLVDEICEVAGIDSAELRKSVRKQGGNDNGSTLLL